MACAMVVCSFLILCPSSSTSTLQRFQHQSLYRVGLIPPASPCCDLPCDGIMQAQSSELDCTAGAFAEGDAVLRRHADNVGIERTAR
jgi:hypothetical protein